MACFIIVRENIATPIPWDILGMNKKGGEKYENATATYHVAGRCGAIRRA